MARRLEVEIIGDTSSLDKAFRRSSRETSKWADQTTTGFKRFQQDIGKATQASQGLRGALSTAGGKTGFLFGSAEFVGAAAATAAIKTSVEVASNLSEQISKSRQVFGDSSKAIEQWSTTTAASMGIAQDQAIETAGSFGNLLKTVGIAPAAAANMSKALVTLAADLASFNNADPSDVLLAIRSGLVGEAEPLRRFGVLLSETRVQQQALADTGKRNVKALTDQEKALARYEIILQDTKSAQGDFTRTSEGLANQQRILAARLRDVEARLGAAFIPLMLTATNAMSDASVVALKLSDVLNKIGRVKVPGLGRVGPLAKEIFLQANPATGSLHRLKQAIDLFSGGGGDVKMTVRGEEQIVAALNTVDALRSSTIGGIGLDINVRVKGLAEATSEIESLRSVTLPTLGDTFTPPRTAGGKSPADIAKQRNAWFDAAIGRKEDRARDIENLRAQNAALAKIAAEISTRIARTKDITRRLKLEDELVSVQRQIADNRKQIAENMQTAARDARQRQVDAGQAFIDSLGLKLDRAEATKTFADDLAVLKQIEVAIRKQMQVEGRTTALLRQLFEIRQKRLDLQKQQAEAQRAERTRRQFRLLGLGPTGEQLIPGRENLQKRLASITKGISGTPLEKKFQTVMAGIRKILSSGLDIAPEVRAKIAEIFDGIRSEIEGQQRKGPRTKGGVINPDFLFAGLGLTEAQIAALKARLGRQARGGGSGSGRRAPGAFPTTGRVAVGGGVVVNGPITVVTNNPNQVLKDLQRKARRRATQTTGPHAGNATGTTR